MVSIGFSCTDCTVLYSVYSLHRFADFVEGSFHLDDDELLSFDAGDSAMLPLMTSDEDSDDEIDFRLTTT